MAAASELYEALRRSWSIETSSLWTPDTPARGQCGVTALVVQDVLGGDLLKTDVEGVPHFYNAIDGLRWDFTFSQFDCPIGYADLPATRQEALADTTGDQYAILATRISTALISV